MSTLALCVASDSTSPAIIIPAKPKAITLSHRDLGHHVRLFQQKLASMSLARGAAVAISMPNSLELVVAFIAAACNGSIAAPLNPAYKQGEFEFYIGDLSAGVLLVSQGEIEQNSEAVKAAKASHTPVFEVYWDGEEMVVCSEQKQKVAPNASSLVGHASADDIALILHTSGTTGKPKAVPLTHQNITRSMRNIQATYNLTADDRTMLVMPLFHIHGLVASLFSSLGVGGSVIIPPRFSASKFWEDYVTHEATWFSAVPTIHQIILKNPIPSPRPFIRFIRSCSSPLPPTVFYALEEQLGAPVLEAYAMTEAAHQMTSNPLSPGVRRPGSVGVPQGVELHIKDDHGQSLAAGVIGEVCIRGENVTKGYLNNPEANRSTFTPDGFLRTGDQGLLDTDGYLILTGRIKELINKGGEKLSPIELDNIFTQHPDVIEAVSFAVADDLYGQDVGVAVVVKEKSTLTQEEFVQWVRERAAKFKIPKKVFFTKVMPKTATGKVQRRLVAEAMLNQHKTGQQANDKLSQVPEAEKSSGRSILFFRGFTTMAGLLLLFIGVGRSAWQSFQV